MNKVIQQLDWELIEYNQAWKEQEAIFAETISRKIQELKTENYLIFCEHPHVYTLGKSGDEQNLLLNYLQLQAKNAQFVHTNRGGDITYHGPGQIVGYPIFDLANFGIGLKEYINRIEACIIELLQQYNIQSERLEGATGVWLDTGTKQARKICAIGVRSSRYVTMHGFALNINTDLSYFGYINPCGFTDKGVTSLEKELGKKQDIAMLKAQLRKIFEKKFSV
ncbi:MAG: lipoyl(octanoyl) transferase LipB [Paludibacter sp.]|nr:lipoyl(octanoyl) transferase LipB [Paludibacter sp.]MDD4199528.1 lipoyl(octanoyl) transferase LipB [Paludibacter sp.]MDD4428403.1 lipoyl(octanoyl) transferase LipB [Paludibacter sp.]